MFNPGSRRTFGALFGMVSAVIVSAAAIAADDPQSYSDRITSLNVVTGVPVIRSAWPYPVEPGAVLVAPPARLSVGSALSPQQGIGPGEAVDMTWDDAQYTVGQGRHIGHWWNGLYGTEAQVDVHFGYRDMQQVAPGQFRSLSGYNVYAAEPPGGDWPVGQLAGSELQTLDNLGYGEMPSLDVMENGLVVMGATSAFFRDRLDGTRLVDNVVYYQGDRWNVVWDSRVPLNVTWVDSSVYRPHFLNKAPGTYSRTPQVVTQWDGTNTIVHLLLIEDMPGAYLSGGAYCDLIPYYSCTYFRKIGETSGSGSWSAGKVIDSIWFPWVSMAAAPYPYQAVAVTYTNASQSGLYFEEPYDLDVWLRESQDRGLSWGLIPPITNYRNDMEGDPNHFTAWLESQALYSTDGDLHVVWTAKPTSLNPYWDGFNWNGFDQNIYHWSKSSNQILAVANGTFTDFNDYLCGNFTDHHCGYGGSNAGYIANVNIAQCDDKLYCVWNQIHERANRFSYDPCDLSQPAPGVLDDCAYTGNRMARANWEIMMSVKRLGPDAWDMPRNISNTYTPGCGLPGDPEANGLCGSEYKPSVERYGFDEAGLDLSWPPGATVDLTPEGDPSYTGTHFLNMMYLDDEFPGPSMWGEWRTDQRTNNAIKWIRLACVEPVEAAEIAVSPREIRWPNWVRTGQSRNFTVTVTNEGNVVLNIVQIGTEGGAWLSVSENPTPSTPFQIPPGVANTDNFDIIINAGGISQPTWLDGLIWLRSDAVNADSLAIPIRVLAADTVEPVVWDTVKTHPDMYSPYVAPVGTCVGLAVGNNGELGWGGGSDGRANLDYTDATPAMPVSRRECDTTRDENRFYLFSATPFVIVADASDGSGAVLTQVYRDRDQADPTGFDPTSALGSITGGRSASDLYDSVYTGRFVNRDTSIALERIVYTPRSDHPATDIINFVVVCTKVYSADGQPHNHVTIGNVTDWNVPSDRANNNKAGVGGRFVYVQGTDTAGHDGCASNQSRFAAEAFVGGWTSDWMYYDCRPSMIFQGQTVRGQLILVDTTYMRDGNPLDPHQPNPLVWWQIASAGGLNVDPVPDTGMDLCMFTTYKHDYNLAATDTLYFWTALTTTPIGGTLAELSNQVNYAKDWYFEVVVAHIPECSCCEDRVGDANGEGFYPDEVTLGDIMLLVDVVFISSDCSKLWCADEADVNQDGTQYDYCLNFVTLGDIMYLVDYLFITGPENMTLPACL